MFEKKKRRKIDPNKGLYILVLRKHKLYRWILMLQTLQILQVRQHHAWFSAAAVIFSVTNRILIVRTYKVILYKLFITLWGKIHVLKKRSKLSVYLTVTASLSLLIPSSTPCHFVKAQREGEQQGGIINLCS